MFNDKVLQCKILDLSQVFEFIFFLILSSKFRIVRFIYNSIVYIGYMLYINRYLMISGARIFLWCGEIC